jgi:tRNA A-37 threonylcarbamoyl transferase component Bud32
MPPSRVQKDALVGQTIAGCRLTRKLGRGRTGNVYEARHESTRRTVAVKLLRGEEARNPAMREAFLREARAIAALDHANIVKIYDVLEELETVLIVMELLDGRNVWEMLQDGERFPAERAARIVTQVAAALAAAHREKVVHRDVKPQNILVLEDDQVKVVDFGLAALPGSGGDRVGTPHYMAPEQASRSRIDGAADVYSLGATFYHLLTGKTPYTGETVGEILKAHKEGDLVPPRKIDALIPPSIDAIVKKMMAPAKGYRPSAEEVAKELDEYLAEGEWKRRKAKTRRPAAGSGRRGPPRKGGAAAGLLVGGLLVVAALVAVVFVLSRMTADDTPEEPETPTATSTTLPAVVPGPGPAEPATVPEPELGAEEKADRANRALQAVEDWIRGNPENRDEAIRRLQGVASDWPGTGAGRRARRRAVDLEMQSEPSSERPTRQPRQPERERPPPPLTEEQVLGRLGALRSMTGHLQIDRAHKTLAKLKKATEGTTHAKLVEVEEEALGHVGFLLEELKRYGQASEIPLKKVIPGSGEGAIIGVGDAGIRLRVGGSEELRAWADLEPEQVLALAEQTVPRNVRVSFSLGVFLVRAGLVDQAGHQFQIVQMKDRMGQYSDLIRRLGR